MNVSRRTVKKAQKVKLIIMDVDGVMTDGRIIIGSEGNELKNFDVRDGHGVVLAHRAEIQTAIMTGRESEAVARRADELSIKTVYQKVWDKPKAFEELLANTHFSAEETCFIGDDIVDLPVMRKAGFSVAVANAVPDVKKEADYITYHDGGRGAVREAIEFIIKAQGKWQEVTKKYYE